MCIRDRVALCGAAAYFGTVYANSRTMPEPQNVVVYQAPSGNASVTGGARLDAASVAAAASDSVVEITTESVQTGSYFNQYAVSYTHLDVYKRQGENPRIH